MRQGYSYSVSFTITTVPDDLPFDLTGATAVYCINGLEFAATISAPLTGVIEVSLTPAQTATIAKGRHEVWCKVTTGSEIKSYGEHRITVTD